MAMVSRILDHHHVYCAQHPGTNLVLGLRAVWWRESASRWFGLPNQDCAPSP